MKKIFFLLVASGAVTIGGAMAEGFFPPAYDAVYRETTSKGVTAKEHRMSDGRGHMRIETSQPGQKNTKIWDYQNRVTYSLIESQQKYMKGPMTSIGAITDADSVRKLNGTPIGERTIEGHPCHGFEIRNGQTVSQIWIGDDIRIPVYGETNTPGGKTVKTLVSYSGRAPSGDLMAIPSGYQAVQAPERRQR